MAYTRTVTMRNFRNMDLMSGNLRVVGRSRRRRGARPPIGAAIERKQLEKAATDDESGQIVSGDAPSSGATATTRKANAGAAKKKPTAERATEKPKGENNRKKSDAGDLPSLWDRRMELGKGPPLPGDGRAFLEALNEQIDVVSMYVLLLRSADDKLAGRLAEQALKLGYGEDAEASAESFQALINDLPRPKRD